MFWFFVFKGEERIEVTERSRGEGGSAAQGPELQGCRTEEGEAGVQV